MPNRLAEAASPYLRQHKDNPVDWYEWGPEAFAAAALTDRPILLSVGYASCHWCHVMAHESFEDPATAELMNDNFISVKVDREERPDVDRIYMDAVTAMTGHGGWPMTVFLTPDRRPIYAGTYFPKRRLHGMPSFTDVLEGVRDIWNTNRPDALDRATRLTEVVNTYTGELADLPNEAAIGDLLARLETGFDPVHGGFGAAPKFPQPTTLEMLLRLGAFAGKVPEADRALEMLTKTLDEMARGGIYDHLGGGFFRYSVDRSWLVPHFEKMLYDNAQLARTYLRAWQLTGEGEHLRIARETLDYLIRDMTDPTGALHSAEDADSEGVEGKFYVWTWDQLGIILGDDRRVAAEIYGASAEGNFERTNILHLSGPLTDEMAHSKSQIDHRLRQARADRTRPAKDDKAVIAWNGLALRAFAEAAAVLRDDTYLEIAERIAEFIVGPASPGGRLVRTWWHGRPGVSGFCDDYAASSLGLFALYEATGETRWYREAERLTRETISRFADNGGGFFATAHDAEKLIARPKNFFDSPTPSDNALAAEAILMLAAYTGESDLNHRFETTVQAAGSALTESPGFAGHMLAVWSTALFGIKEIAVLAQANHVRDFADVVWERFRPEAVLAIGDGSDDTVPLLAGRSRGPTGLAYVCRGFVCDMPAATPDELRTQLDADQTPVATTRYEGD